MNTNTLVIIRSADRLLMVNIGFFRYKYKYGIPIQPCLKVIFRNVAPALPLITLMRSFSPVFIPNGPHRARLQTRSQFLFMQPFFGLGKVINKGHAVQEIPLNFFFFFFFGNRNQHKSQTQIWARLARQRVYMQNESQDSLFAILRH